MPLHQDEIIRQFIEQYNTCQDGKYTITYWPDKKERHRRACDAYAEAQEMRPLAIEHTKIQSFKNQKLDSARFDQVIGVLTAELHDSFPYDMILITPTFAIQEGTDWHGIRDTLRAWLLIEANNLPFGHSDHQIEGVPFRISISKKNRRGRGIGFGVAREAPLDMHDTLIELVAAALENKHDQLKQYHDNGDVAILILETDDIALMNHVTLYKAFLQASEYTATPHIDQVWIAENINTDDTCSFICFDAPESIMDNVNPPEWMLEKRYTAYWREMIERDRIGTA